MVIVFHVGLVCFSRLGFGLVANPFASNGIPSALEVDGRVLKKMRWPGLREHGVAQKVLDFLADRNTRIVFIAKGIQVALPIHDV